MIFTVVFEKLGAILKVTHFDTCRDPKSGYADLKFSPCSASNSVEGM